MTLLSVRDVHKNYLRGSEEVHALRGLSFEIGEGEIVALVGPSGSGKSTLLNVIAGWETPDRGDLVWRGGGPPPTQWSELAVLPQKLGLIQELSVRENISLPLKLSSRSSDGVDRLLEELGLDKFGHRLPSEVSVGEQQRAAFARALILEPSLLLLDEPTGHQDAAWARAMFDLLRQAARRSVAALVVTHNPELLAFVDRTLGIRDGELAEVETA